MCNCNLHITEPSGNKWYSSIHPSVPSTSSSRSMTARESRYASASARFPLTLCGLNLISVGSNGAASAAVISFASWPIVAPPTENSFQARHVTRGG